ncbi:MAG TPA: helix-turn-helix domain-containing protein [Vicinamibacterales bacterium]|nr:helix-turn-helix domain-containing protein [Vicinamibacterales bacterium]
MPAVSETLVHHHDETLTSTARALSGDSQRAEREAAAFELRHAFCAQLKAARERRGITLQQISERTKVSEGLFAGLERCDLSRWPTGVYRRAFFREYAALVGLPGESIVGEFVRLFPEDLENAPAEVLVPGPLRLTLARPFWRHLSPMHAVAAGIDLLMVFAGATAIAQLAQVNLWVALGVMAVAYHTVGTSLRGCSLGTWWLRMRKRRQRSKASWTLLLALALASPATAQESTFKPEVGQAGKDVVWVPTPEVMVEKMLDMAKVTPQDYVIDLGSGDGRNVIGAAKRGASALGVEFNPNMVELSRRLAKEAGVTEKAQFVEGDMFVADISKASVMALFLLPSNLLRLRDKFLDLRPGSRIVSNTFSIQDWQADATETIDDCQQWCTAMLYIVPAKVGGTWKAGSDVLELKQEFQMLTGTLTSGGQATQVSGSLRGTDLTLKAGDRSITGRVQGNQIDGTLINGTAKSAFRATR